MIEKPPAPIAGGFSVRIDIAHDADLVLAQALLTASSGGCGAWAGFNADPPDDAVCDAEGAPGGHVSGDGRADVTGGYESRRGRTEGCLFRKISILISAYGSTAECELCLSGLKVGIEIEEAGPITRSAPLSFALDPDLPDPLQLERVRPVEVEVGARERRWARERRSWRQGSSKPTWLVLVAVSCTAMGFTGRPLRRTS